MGVVTLLNHMGDEPVIDWDPADDASVAEAEKKWDELKEKGYEFFEPAETKGKRIKKFSRELGRVLASPAPKAKSRRSRAFAGGPNDFTR